MKRFLVLSLFVLGVFINLTAQTRYLVNTHTPVDSYRYTAYKYTGTSSKQMDLSGGLKWCGGFTLGLTQGPYTPGYATFKLGGKYEKLMFVLAPETGSGVNIEPSIVTVLADGRKILDEKIYPYSVPKRITLNIKDVDELTFKLVMGESIIGIAEATLWTAGQTPIETGNLITQKPKTVELVKDIKPYFLNNRFESISPNDKTTAIKINGQAYNYGLMAQMHMAILGNNPGWAYFNLRKQYSKFSFVIGPIDNTDSYSGNGWFTVKADNKIIYEKHMTYEDIAERVTLDVVDCEMLSFHTEQEDGSTDVGIVQMMVYPEGEEPKLQQDGAEATIDPCLKKLPDVCKLISNIPPYAAGALTKNQIYDGTSDYITFSMGGVKYSEGIILYEKANVLSDNTSAYAVFDVGNEFDYVTFTAGYLGASGVLNNDVLRVYADDKVVLETPLMATAPNQQYKVPLNRCRKLRFENQGSSNLAVAAFGVADIVVYRGQVVENDLFVHPKPDCPQTIDLIDLGAPYIHYVSPMKDAKDKIFYDGTTQRNYFDLNGQHITKGFILQTSVHFSLDFGVLSGTDGAAAGALGGAAVGSAFVAGGAAVGGAVVGSTLIGAAAFLMLAAGGTAMENSCAAFNTYGEYNSVTFTVACYNPNKKLPSDYKESLLISADHEVMVELAVYETMEPQTITVPINGCEQLMFWLANTGNWSAQYVFYDIKLSKESSELDVPKAARLSTAVVSQPIYTERSFQNKWSRPNSSGQKHIDDFFSDLSNAYSKIVSLIDKSKPIYEIHTYYLETEAGNVCKAVSLPSAQSGVLRTIRSEHIGCARQIEQLKELKSDLIDLSIQQTSAALDLPYLGLNAISYGKLLKVGGKVLKECKVLVDELYDEKVVELNFLQTLLDTAMNIDGKQSTGTLVFCPLFQGETPPAQELQLVKYFTVK